MKKYSLGIFIDGHLLKAALINRTGKKLIIEKLDTFKLYELLEQINEPKENSNEQNHHTPKTIKGDDPFNIELENFKESEEGGIPNEVNSNLDIITELHHRMCPENATVAFNLIDANVLYKTISGLKESQPNKIKKAVWKEFNENASLEPRLENVGYQEAYDGKIVGMYHDDPLILASLILEANRVSQVRPPLIKLIDTIEFTLAHEIRLSHNIEEEEYTAILVFAKTFTKIFFMRGEEIISVLPTIDEGANSETICETVFSKILFEFDSGNIGPLTHLILVGESEQAKAENYFKRKLPALAIEHFQSVRATLDPHLNSEHIKAQSYGIPIALALKAMDGRNDSPYKQNFIPRRIRDKQFQYKLAWHGILMLCLLFLGVLFLSSASVQKKKESETIKHIISNINTQIDAKSSLNTQQDSLNSEIMKLEKSATLLDSLSQNTTRWSPILETFSDAFNKLGPFYIDRIKTLSKDEILIETEITKREQVAKLERFMANGTVINVSKSEEEGSDELKMKLECKINSQK